MWNKEEKKEQKTYVYWCNHCKTPIIKPLQDRQYCPVCNKRLKRLSQSVRPVFPAERRLVELLTGKTDLLYTPLWKSKVCYYENGKAFVVPDKLKLNANDKFLRKELLSKKFDDTYFKKEIEKFITYNKEHLDYITQEAIDFIREESNSYTNKNKVVSFSGGKDSTVTSSLVCRAFPDEKIIHIFSDTTLEGQETLDYVERLKKDKHIDMHIARNNDNNFLDMAKKIGPPTMTGRWCCYMFKTGAFNREMTKLFDGSVLTFLGVRRAESTKRQNYNRVENKTESIKIANQKVVAPIVYWSDCEVWLYILANNLDFNRLYTYGFNRAGCFCCPNSTMNSELMERIYNHKRFEEWQRFLIDFANKSGIENPEEYVKVGNWKKRSGGNGIEAAKTVKLKSAICTAEENGKVYDLLKDISPAFFNLYTPFGIIQEGRKELNEKLLLDIKTQTPYVSLQPLNKRQIKIVTINVKNPKLLHSRLAYQVIKYNACNQCLKCESLCKFGAISIGKNGYHIDENKCKHCQVCVNNKYLSGGCLMCRYLRTKKGADL